MKALIYRAAKLIQGAIALSLILFCGAASAHYPLMQCQYVEQVIECEAGYSDGSKAVDYEVRMFDYDDNLIAKANTDIRSIATFKKISEQFYLVFDAGHENPVEVDSVEIQ